jgi:hypothetical protein
MMAVIDQLPDAVRNAIDAFVASAREAFVDDLVSVTLFGSASEGRLRPTSDVNVIIVLSRCDPARLAAIGDAYRMAHAAIRLSTMFILDTEIAGAAEAFAVKFSDIAARHVVLYGRDVFTGLAASRESALRRLQQVVLNLLLRLRERYALSSAFPEQLVEGAADAVGPLRACAAVLLSLASGASVPPREALQQVAADAASGEMLATITKAREEGQASASDPAATLLAAINLAAMVQARVAMIT